MTDSLLHVVAIGRRATGWRRATCLLLSNSFSLTTSPILFKSANCLVFRFFLLRISWWLFSVCIALALLEEANDSPNYICDAHRTFMVHNNGIGSIDMFVVVFDENPFMKCSSNAERGGLTNLVKFALAVGSNTRELSNVLGNAIVKLIFLPFCNTDDTIIETEQIVDISIELRILDCFLNRHGDFANIQTCSAQYGINIEPARGLAPPDNGDETFSSE